MDLHDFKLGPSVCHEAFPFHLILNKDLLICQVGIGLKKLIPTIKLGNHFQDFLHSSDLSFRLTYGDIEHRIKNTFVFKSVTNSAVEIRGGFYLVDNNYVLFIADPVIRKTSKIAELSLKYCDFSPHNQILHYLAASQAREALLDDTHELVRKLNAGTQQLEERAVALELARDAAEEANRAKSAFLANMSHELRTPLQIVIGYCEVMRDEIGKVQPEQPALLDNLDEINSVATHLVSLISDVLDMSKIEAGKSNLHVTTFAVVDVVDEVVATITQLIKKNGNSLKLSFAEDVGTIRSDATKVRQVILNLVSNAAKFTENGQIEVSLRRDVIGLNDMIIVDVRDSGIGITKENLKLVFDPFMQVEEPEKTGKTGTGLGLAITREYCHLLDGVLEATSTPGEGSLFTANFAADILAARVRARKS